MFVFQIFLLAFMAGQREYVFQKGKMVYLRTIPIDPRDLFRGDYVRLNYEISFISSDKLRDGLEKSENKQRNKDRKVYVVLEPDEENVANILYATDKKPGKEQLFIRGRLQHNRSSGILVRYGIETYFVEQGKGKDLEKRRVKGHRASLEMKIALGSGGIAVIKGHRWTPISLELNDLELKDNFPRSAKLSLTNISDKPVAIVDLPGSRSLGMKKDERRWWSNEKKWRWVNDDAAAPMPTDNDVHLLAPGQSYKLAVDFNDPYWSISFDGKTSLVSKYGFRRSPFRIVYRPPSSSQCGGLENADLIWHGWVSSQSIPNRD